MPRDAAIPPNSDFSALLAAFNDAGVEYLLIGGRAYSFHDQPRYTKDYDIWIRPTIDNAERAYAALVRFGAPLGDITRDDLIDPDASNVGSGENADDSAVAAVSAASPSSGWCRRSRTRAVRC